MRRRNAGERRGHANGLAIRLEEQHAIRPQPRIGRANVVSGALQFVRYVGEFGRLARGGEIPVDGQLDVSIKVYLTPDISSTAPLHAFSTR